MPAAAHQGGQPSGDAHAPRPRGRIRPVHQEVRNVICHVTIEPFPERAGPASSPRGPELRTYVRPSALMRGSKARITAIP